jgi:hypothetical protein
MKKRRRKNSMLAPTSPSPHTMMRWSAESMARSALENHPMMKRAKDEITSVVMAATEKALKTSLRGGTAKKK